MLDELAQANLSARIAEMRTPASTSLSDCSRARRGPSFVTLMAARSSTCAANNYLGLADDPRRDRGRQRRRSKSAGSAWLRCGSSAARWTFTASWSSD